MNRNVLISLWSMCMVALLFVGCEVQGPAVNSDPEYSEIEDSVSLFANSIDPYERYSRSEIYAMLEEFMHVNPDIYATGFGITGPMNSVRDFFYIYKDGTTYITIDGFDYGSVDKGVFESLQAKVAIGEQFWSQKYIREDGSGSMIPVRTFFTPIVNDTGKVVYVLTVDQIEENE